MHTGIRHPSSVMKNVIPIVMAGVIGIYGLIVAVILSESIAKPAQSRQNAYSIYTGLAHVSYDIWIDIQYFVSEASPFVPRRKDNFCRKKNNLTLFFILLFLVIVFSSPLGCVVAFRDSLLAVALALWVIMGSVRLDTVLPR